MDPARETAVAGMFLAAMDLFQAATDEAMEPCPQEVKDAMQKLYVAWQELMLLTIPARETKPPAKP